ncbi:MAG: ATP-binding protein [Candidatus Omnitrophota bacterium]|nr:ATP-binding protein [Candidatus Omnitrophota bacterium]MDZ4242330.1 ATP-binding protein [Candidatus Omnitrophota bacterium]
MDTEQFFGRENVLALLKKRLTDLKEGYRQNIALLGRQHVGKTMILQKFLSEIDDHAVVAIYLDLSNTDFPAFYHRYAGQILYQFSRLKGLPTGDDLSALCEKIQPHLPQTVRAILNIRDLIAQDRESEACREILSLPEVFSQESNLYCVLIIDEFHHLEELGGGDAFQELGKKIMTQKRCLYIVSSSFPAVAGKILTEKLSLLFGNFEEIPLNAFDPGTGKEFVSVRLKGLAMGEQLNHFLIDFTGGHPLYLHLITQELLHLAAVHQQKEVFVPLLARAVERVLFDPWGVLSRHFELMVNRVVAGKGNQLISSVLISLSGGKQKLKDIADDIAATQSVLQPRLNRLLEQGLAAKSGHFYYLHDKMLRFWVKYVYQRRLRSLDPDPEKQRAGFQQEFEASVENFKRASGEDLSSRIVDLLYCFENEALHVNGRRYKLPLFEQIVQTKVRSVSGSPFDIIKATGPEGDWWVVLKKGGLSENDIQTIMTESKRNAQKPQKCILVALNAMDENTRVKALAERMWIWSESEINSLLNLYGKPFIVG